MRVLITGMSGTGKSALVRELRHRGHQAYSADDDGFSAPDSAGIWRWRVDAVAALLDNADGTLLFAGCSDEQRDFSWDLQVLLTAPEGVIVERLRTRLSNPYGKSAAELARVLADREAIEPLLRRSADVVIDTTQPIEEVVDAVLSAVGPAARDGGSV